MKKNQRWLTENEIKQYIAEIMAGDDTHASEFRMLCYKMFLRDAKRRNFHVSDVAQDEDDIFQDVMEKVVKSLKNYNDEYPFANWFYSVCHSVEANLVEKFLRTGSTESLYETIGDDEDSGYLIDRLCSNDNIEECIINREFIKDAFLHLKENYRQAMTLVYLEGLKVKDAARLLNTTESVLTNWLFRGKNRMRNLIINDPIPEPVC